MQCRLPNCSYIRGRYNTYKYITYAYKPSRPLPEGFFIVKIADFNAAGLIFII